jgi:hypothetical protein
MARGTFRLPRLLEFQALRSGDVEAVRAGLMARQAEVGLPTPGDNVLFGKVQWQYHGKMSRNTSNAL